MSRKKRHLRATKATPRPLSGDRPAPIEVRTLTKEEQDAAWLAQNYRDRPAPPPIEVPETPPHILALMHQVELARKTWADTHFKAKEPHLRYTPYVGPRFQPPTPGFMRRKARFAQR